MLKQLNEIKQKFVALFPPSTAFRIDVSDYIDYRGFELSTLYEFEEQNTLDPQNIHLLFSLVLNEDESIMSFRIKTMPGLPGIVCVHYITNGVDLTDKVTSTFWELIDFFLRSIHVNQYYCVLPTRTIPRIVIKGMEPLIQHRECGSHLYFKKL